MTPYIPPHPLILVVDDDMMTRVLVTEALEPEGFRIAEAASGPIKGDAPAAKIETAIAPAPKAKVTKVAKVKQAKAPKPVRTAEMQHKPERAPRKNTKQQRLIEMLRSPKGVSVPEIAEALEWQYHTVRGAFAGALKKKLGLVVSSTTDEKRGRVYRLEHAAA